MVQPIPEYRRNLRHLIHRSGFCLNHGCQRQGLIQRQIQFVHSFVVFRCNFTVEVLQNLLAHQVYIHIFIENIGVREQIAFHRIELFIDKARQVGFIRIAIFCILVEKFQEFFCLANACALQHVSCFSQVDALRKCNLYRSGFVHCWRCQFFKDGFIRHIRTKFMFTSGELSIFITSSCKERKHFRMADDASFFQNVGNFTCIRTGRNVYNTSFGIIVDAQQVPTKCHGQSGNNNGNRNDCKRNNQCGQYSALPPFFLFLLFLLLLWRNRCWLLLADAV